MPNLRIPLTRESLEQLYCVERKSPNEIGRLLGCHGQTIRNRMREWGIPERSASESMRLIKRTEQWGQRIAASNRGKRLSEETKRKISEAHKRRGMPPATKGLRKATHPDKVTCGCAGPAHWNWKGGISSENNRFRQSSEYKAWRDQVFRRDDWTCQLCGRRGGYLEADHILMFAHHPEKRLELANGRTLCKKCHKGVTSSQRKRKTRDSP